MLARIVKDEQDNLTWERLTSSVVGGTPLGAVYAIWSNTVPDGFLPCNGAQFDKTQYPFLYNMLRTDYLPDLRECTLVGIGQNDTDTLTTHDTYTLGQFKDFSTAGSGAIKTAGYNVSGNNVTLNTTVNAANRKLVTQYVADADATDLQTLDIGGAAVTRMRSKGVNYIIKAIPGNDVGDYNAVIDQMEAQLALKMSLEYVNALPTGSDIGNNIYGYQGHYYIGDHDNETLTQLDVDAIAMIDEGDPLPTGSAIKSKLYVQPETVGSSTKYHYYVGDTTVTPHVLIEMSTGGSDIFVGTQAEWNLLSAAEQAQYTQANLTDVNSVVNVPVDTVANGNMNPPTSNSVFNSLYLKGTSATEVLNVSRDTTVVAGTDYDYTTTATIQTDGWYKFQVQANIKDNAGVISNYVKFEIGTVEAVNVSTFAPVWNNKINTVIIPVKAGTVVTYHAHCAAYGAGTGTDITYGNYGSVYKII